ncbi:unnamed protein product [Scytosiphon promiscuus]
MDDTILDLKDLAPSTLQDMPDLESELAGIDISINRAKSEALPPPGNAPADEQRCLLDGVGLQTANEGMTVVGVPIGTDEFVRNFAMKVDNEGRAEKLARMLTRMPDGQVAHPVSSLSLTQRSAYIERRKDPTLIKEAWERLDNMVQ